MTEKLRVGVVDAGGRGAALAHAYLRSPEVAEVHAFPGNDLMKVFNTQDKRVTTYPNLKTTSVEAIIEACHKNRIDLLDVAQDNAVAAGLVDEARFARVPVVGPTQEAGRIESDKGWARMFGNRQGLLQPAYKICTSPEEGYEFLEAQPDQPWYVKAVGLAEGKGALPAENRAEAQRRILELERFGEAGRVFTIEHYLRNDDGTPGEEFSSFAVTDGTTVKVLGHAQDHKRINNHDADDEGENTGGMGCSSNPLLLTPDLLARINEGILQNAVRGMKQIGKEYTGVIYFGGMIIKKDSSSGLYTIEWNARWGDPEAEVILPGLITDMTQIGYAVVNRNLREIDIKSDKKKRVTIAGASKGYPGDYSNVRGREIKGLKAAANTPGVTLYTAGIQAHDARYYAHGGRLFYLTGEGSDINEARERAHEAMAKVSVSGGNLHYRTDIGWRDVERLQQQGY